MSTDTRTVTIPARSEHQGYERLTVTLRWVCPVCGGPRGEPYAGLSYDGSRRLYVDQWDNPCGHVDKYSDVRREAEASAITWALDEIGGTTERADYGAHSAAVYRDFSFYAMWRWSVSNGVECISSGAGTREECRAMAEAELVRRMEAMRGPGYSDLRSEHGWCGGGAE